MVKAQINSELADFGGGCFWGVEEVFRKIPGVIDTKAGYEGGHTKSPSYEQVCTHTTGHAETVQIEFDPKKVSYMDLLDIFFENHDPSQVDRQGPDIGDSYRSVVFYHGQKQQAAAEKKIRELEQAGQYQDPIATQLIAAGTFWKAEEYHQQYLHKRNLNVCH